MKKALATFIDIYYQLPLYYIDKLKDSFKVYCYENVQKYKECSGSRVLGSFLDSYNFHLTVLCKRTDAAKSFSGLSSLNKHSATAFIVICPLEKDNNSVFYFSELLSLYLHTKFFF